MNTPLMEMAKLKDWAQERLREGAEPPWSYYRMMQLIDAVDALSSGAEAVSPTAHSLESESLPGEIHPQGANIYRLDTSRRHPAEPPVRLPT